MAQWQGGGGLKSQIFAHVICERPLACHASEVAAVVEEVKHSLLGQFAFVHVPKGERGERERRREEGS